MFGISDLMTDVYRPDMYATGCGPQTPGCPGVTWVPDDSARTEQELEALRQQLRETLELEN